MGEGGGRVCWGGGGGRVRREIVVAPSAACVACTAALLALRRVGWAITELDQWIICPGVASAFVEYLCEILTHRDQSIELQRPGLF